MKDKIIEIPIPKIKAMSILSERFYKESIIKKEKDTSGKKDFKFDSSAFELSLINFRNSFYKDAGKMGSKISMKNKEKKVNKLFTKISTNKSEIKMSNIPVLILYSENETWINFKYLISSKFSVIKFAENEEAFIKFYIESIKNNENIQIVFLDLNKLNSEGFRTALKLREKEKEFNSRQCFIYGLSTEINEKVLYLCNQTGINQCIKFPPIEEDINNIIQIHEEKF